jgi:replication factor A1
MDDSIAPIIDELNRALGVDRDTLERELTLLIIDYKVPVEEAKRSIVKKHSGDGTGTPASVAGTSIPGIEDPSIRLLKDLRNGDTGVSVLANVIEPRYREITTSRGTTTVINGMLEDSTAKIHFTAWIDSPCLFSGKAVLARSVYVNSFHGMPSVNIGEKSVLEEFGGDIPGYTPRRCSLLELTEGDGAYDIEIEGDVVSIRPGSGLIERCPICSRVMQKGQCRAHGRSDGVKDLRVKAIMDDGTGSMICVFDRTLTKSVLGEMLEAELESGSVDNIEERIKSALIGMPFTVRGNVTRGDYGRILIATRAQKPGDDIGKLARELMVSLK